MLEVFRDDIHCHCPARKECRHIRIYKRWRDKIKGNPDKCWWSGKQKLEEHHLIRGSGRRESSLTIWLNHHIHQWATLNKDFENHLIKLFFEPPKIMDINVKTQIKQISFKNLSSQDGSVWIDLQSTDNQNAIQFAKLKLSEKTEPELVKLVFGEKEMWGGVAKADYDIKENRTYIRIEAPQREIENAVELVVWNELNRGDDLELVYKK